MPEVACEGGHGGEHRDPLALPAAHGLAHPAVESLDYGAVVPCARRRVDCTGRARLKRRRGAGCGARPRDRPGRGPRRRRARESARAGATPWPRSRRRGSAECRCGRPRGPHAACDASGSAGRETTASARTRNAGLRPQALRDPGGFHHQRSHCHRVPERCGPVVAEQEQQRRGQRFAQRRIRSTRAIAPQVQRPTREVEVDGRVGLAEVDQHGHVRRARIDVGTRARLVAHDVADGVLHLEGREPGMPERRRATGRRDGERPSGGEMFLPGDRPRPGVQHVGVGCRKGRQGEKNLHRRAQVQACPHAVLDGSGEADRPTV